MKRLLVTVGLACVGTCALAGSVGAQDVVTPSSGEVVVGSTTTTTLPSTTEAPADDTAATTEVPPTTGVPRTSDVLANAEPLPALPTTSAPPGSGGPTGDVRAQQCDPSYPTICLTPGVEVDCIDIPEYGNFVVVPPDPFRLDADGDGVGCEENTTGASVDPAVTTTLPTTVPPTTAPPATVPPTTVPATVAGVTQTPTTQTLPVTGTTSTLLAVLGFVLLALGGAFVAARGRLDDPLTGRLRGGFTVTTVDRSGQQITYRVTTRR